MNARMVVALPIATALLLCSAVRAADEIPAHQLRPIAKAAPDKPRVTPGKPRRVLVSISPPHIMDPPDGRSLDPHKGYCVPYGSAAFSIACGSIGTSRCDTRW
jgi:hypothetical protein